jgi:hypothetical protein
MIIMKFFFIRFILVSLLLFSWVAWADEIVGSGDPVIDQSLKDINAVARENLKGFGRRMAEKFGVPPRMVDTLLDDRKMSPADAYMTLNTAQVAHKPVEEVVRAYEGNKEKGWGVIAKEMGIKPGSTEFHQLRRNCRDGLSKDSAKGQGKGQDQGAKIAERLKEKQK